MESTVTAADRDGEPNALTELFQRMDIDEGFVIDMEQTRDVKSSDEVSTSHVEEPLGLGEDMRSESISKTKDSGLSSRMSETDVDERTGHQILLLDAAKGEAVLNKRLARISECQYEEPCSHSPKELLKATIKMVLVFGFLYLFVCNIDLLVNAYRLLGGRTAGRVFSDTQLLGNPIVGLMLGAWTSALLQSSSTMVSILIAMVAANILPLHIVIPMVMGANIGTAVTNTIASFHSGLHGKEFQRAFSAAVVHDVFNWLTVLVLLPLEYCTGYLYHLTDLLVGTMALGEAKDGQRSFLNEMAKLITKKIIMLDEKLLTDIAEGKEGNGSSSLLKEYCAYSEVPLQLNMSTADNVTGGESWTGLSENSSALHQVGTDKCDALFNVLGWSDTTTGVLLLIASIILLSVCFGCLVKLLCSMFRPQIAKVIRKTIHADFPRPFQWLAGYTAIIVGAGLTILIQSSSVLTSALTPLVGMGCFKLKRMFPVVLGANIGTTFTGILAALSVPHETFRVALQLALCHLCFNITGILLFYPVPRVRKLVISIAKCLGRTTAKHRWFAIIALFFLYLLGPVLLFLISLVGKIAFIIVICLIYTVAIPTIIITTMQKYTRSWTCFSAN